MVFMGFDADVWHESVQIKKVSRSWLKTLAWVLTMTLTVTRMNVLLIHQMLNQVRMKMKMKKMVILYLNDWKRDGGK